MDRALAEPAWRQNKFSIDNSLGDVVETEKSISQDDLPSTLMSVNNFIPSRLASWESYMPLYWRKKLMFKEL